MNQSNSHPTAGLSGPQTDLLLQRHLPCGWNLKPGLRVRHPQGRGYAEQRPHPQLVTRDQARSVLMALDAAGTSTDDLLWDATRRQQALSSYDAGQQKQLQEFEARKARRTRRFRPRWSASPRTTPSVSSITRTRWRKREKPCTTGRCRSNESQRISEVIELCAKQPASALLVMRPPHHPPPKSNRQAARPHGRTAFPSPRLEGKNGAAELLPDKVGCPFLTSPSGPQHQTGGSFLTSVSGKFRGNDPDQVGIQRSARCQYFGLTVDFAR
jgi:hypothetical protein